MAVDKNCALFRAARCGDLDKLRRCIDRGVDLNALDRRGRTAMQEAIIDGHSEFVAEMIKNAANLDVEDVWGKTPAMHAIHEDEAGRLRVLAEAGANLELRDKGGKTQVALSIEQDREECLSVLIEHGADLNGKSSDGTTPLMVAASRFEENIHIVDALLQVGADPNSSNHVGLPPLMISASLGHVGSVRSLLKYGADPCAVDREGKTAMDHAMAEDSPSRSFYAACTAADIEGCVEAIKAAVLVKQEAQAIASITEGHTKSGRAPSRSL